MLQTLWPTPIHEEIKLLETELRICLEKDLPIDTVKLKQLVQLRTNRLKELCSTHQQRMEIMKEKTREMTSALLGLDLELKPELKQKIFEEQDKYDIAAIRWVVSENSLWGESEAASIAAGISILAAQSKGE